MFIIKKTTRISQVVSFFLSYLVLNRSQLIKFFIVGLTTCSIYFLSFHLFYAIVTLDYRIAASIAYLITVFSHFILNRSFTFGASQQKVIMNIWKYLLMLLVNYTTLITIMWVLVKSLINSPYAGVAVSAVLTTVINFIIMKHFVFESKIK